MWKKGGILREGGWKKGDTVARGLFSARPTLGTRMNRNCGADTSTLKLILKLSILYALLKCRVGRDAGLV
jgi:hypothetical protein